MELTVALDGEKKRDLRFFAGDDMSLTIVVYAHDGDITPITVSNVRFAAADGSLPMDSEFVVPSNFLGRAPYRIVGEVDGITTTLCYGVMQTDGGWPCVYCWGYCGPGWGIVGKAENITVLDDHQNFESPTNVESALEELGDFKKTVGDISEQVAIATEAAESAAEDAAYIAGVLPISTDDYGGDIELAIAAGVATGADNIIIDLGEESFFNGVNTAFVTGTKIVTQPNVWLRGKGQPGHNGNFVTIPPVKPTHLVGGSRIMGGLFFAADGFKITRCGLDCGEDYVNANNAGVPIEGLVGVDRGNTGMDGYTSVGPNADPPKHRLYIDEVCVLNKGTGAPGDTSDVHSILLENYVDGYIGEMTETFGGAGIVIKSSGLQIGKVTATGNFKYTLLFKSEDYADASNNHVDLALLSNFKTLNPDINTAVSAPDYDSSGLWFQAANADCNNNRVEMVVANGVTDAVVFDALNALKVTSCTVGKLISRNIGGIPVQTRGTGSVIDCGVENSDHDRSLRGSLIQANALRFTFTNAVFKNVGRWSYENYGVDTAMANCRSVLPGIAHVRLTAGNVKFMGDFATDAGSTKPLLAVVAGTYTGLFRQTGRQLAGLNVAAANLILNGDGESTTGWTTPGAGAVVTIEPGGVTGNFFKISRPTVAQAYFTQQYVTEVGKKYKVSLYQKNGSPGTARFFLGRTTYLSAEYTGGTFVALNNAAWTQYTFVFTATAAACFLTIQVPDAAVSSTGIDGVKCEETPGTTLDTDTLVTGGLTVKDVPVYANNAAAVAAGLDVGRFYRTGADPDPLCIVH